MRALIVEDNGPLRLAIAKRLAEDGYAVDVAADGDEGAWFIQENHYAIGILDIMLPSRSGHELVAEFNEKDSLTSILLMTAKDSVRDRVTGLDAGADDYLVKPFALEELMARVRALLRRKGAIQSAIIGIGELSINLAKREAHRQSQKLPLTSKEFALLELLALRKGQVVRRNQIWEQLYDFNQDANSNVIDVFVGRLRRKVDQAGLRPLIHTRRGLGYILSEHID